MTQEHPITPPLELVDKWRRSGPADAAVNNVYELHIARQAAQWGADQELEACCQVLYSKFASPGLQAATVALEMRDWLRTTRRPKPPELVNPEPASSPAVDRLLDLQDRIQMGSLTLAEALEEIAGPKPPTLKEQALALVSHDFSDQPCLSEEGYAIIRRALEQLPDAL